MTDVPKAILALDPANVTGWAHSNGMNGAIRLSRGDPSGGRLRRLHDWLRSAPKFDAIAYENASFGSHNPAVQAAHNELAGIIKLVAFDLDVPFLPVNPRSLKKFATGSGKATKAQMVGAIRSVLGIENVKDDNQADAIWVLEFAKRHWQDRADERTIRRASRGRANQVQKLF